MTAAIPKTQAAEAMTALQAYVANKMPLDQINKRRLSRMAESSMAADPVRAHIALAMIAVLEWDIPALHHHHQKAIEVHYCAYTHSQYAVSLGIVNMLPEAAANMTIASNLEPTNLDFIRRAISYNQMAGHFNTAIMLADIHKTRSPMNPIPDTQLPVKAAQFLLDHGVNEELVHACNQVAYDFLTSRKIRCAGNRIQVDEEDRTVMFFIELDLPLEQVLDLDCELTPLLFEGIEQFDPRLYWIGFDVIKHHEH